MKKTVPLLVFAMSLPLAACAQTSSSSPRGFSGDMMGNPSAMVDRIFNSFDTNGDGEITRDERIEMFGARFDDADTDGDGFLDSSEQSAAQKEAQSRTRGRRSGADISAMDRNSDGLIQRIEFIAGNSQMLLAADSNGDDITTRAEFDTMVRSRMR